MLEDAGPAMTYVVACVADDEVAVHADVGEVRLGRREAEPSQSMAVLDDGGEECVLAEACA
jgi:hypothetical protein